MPVLPLLQDPGGSAMRLGLGLVERPPAAASLLCISAWNRRTETCRGSQLSPSLPFTPCPLPPTPLCGKG